MFIFCCTTHTYINNRGGPSTQWVQWWWWLVVVLLLLLLLAVVVFACRYMSKREGPPQLDPQRSPPPLCRTYPHIPQDIHTQTDTTPQRVLTIIDIGVFESWKMETSVEMVVCVCGWM